MPEPSAARVLPHTAAGALLLMLGLLARCQSREVVCLKKKKIEILEVQGRENPQMCFQPGLYYLQTCGKYSASSLLIGEELKVKK